MAYMRKNLLQQKMMLFVPDTPLSRIGSTLVTYVQTNDKKMVFPIAILLKIFDAGNGSFGAVYKKVRTPASNIQPT